jgi:hypothetical protein
MVGGNLNPGVTNASTGSVIINGNAYGGISSAGAVNDASGSITITGDAVGSFLTTNVPGATQGQLATGYLTVGRAVATNYGLGSTGIAAAPGVTGMQNSVTLVKSVQYGARGLSPTLGNVFILPDSDNNAATFTKSDLSTLTLIPADRTSTDHASASDVRHGISYALGNRTGTCHVPAANQVSAGVAVDNTLGTAVLTAAAIRAELAIVPSAATVAEAVRAELTDELERVSNCATVATTGAQIAALG